MGFPCNQFGGQEPGTDAEILEFALSNYGVDFPMFSKIEVNGDNQAELYSLLKADQPGEIGWNFTKFLVNPNGKAVARWDTGTTPEQIAAELPGLMS